MKEKVNIRALSSKSASLQITFCSPRLYINELLPSTVPSRETPIRHVSQSVVSDVVSRYDSCPARAINFLIDRRVREEIVFFLF